MGTYICANNLTSKTALHAVIMHMLNLVFWGNHDSNSSLVTIQGLAISFREEPFSLVVSILVFDWAFLYWYLHSATAQVNDSFIIDSNTGCNSHTQQA